VRASIRSELQLRTAPPVSTRGARRGLAPSRPRTPGPRDSEADVWPEGKELLNRLDGPLGRVPFTAALRSAVCTPVARIPVIMS